MQRPPSSPPATSLLAWLFVGADELRGADRLRLVGFSLSLLLGVPVFLIFLVSAIVQGEPVWVVQNLVGTVLLVVLLGITARTRARQAVYTLGCALFTVLVIAQVFTDPTDALGLLWILVLPAVYSFVLPAGRALVFIGASLGGMVASAVVVASQAGLGWEDILNLGLVHLLLSGFSLVAMTLTGRYRSKLEARQEELTRANTEIRRLARTDPLTGCSTRAVLVQDLAEELLRARRYRRPLAVALVDLDHFKRINDTRGHLAGDAVLREVGRALRATSRAGVDRVVRYGGEEFLLVLPETSLEGAKVFAERLCALVGRLHVPWRRGHLRVTASIGVTAVRHDQDEHPEDLLERADALLYEAKAAGRNQVVAG